jgi:hypothetical protein
MNKFETVMMCLGNANPLIAEYITRYRPSFQIEYKRITTYKPETQKPFRQIPNEIWAQWEQTIKQNCWRFQKAKTYDEIYDKLYRLKIRGVGDKTIRATANYLANKFNISLNSDSSHLMSNRVKSIIQKNGLNLATVCREDFIAINPLFKELTMLETIDFIIQFADRLE